MSSTSNEDKISLDKDLFKLEKIEIDTDEKLVAYNLFENTARQLTSESIKINGLIRQIDKLLQCVHKRKAILEAKKKVIDEYSLICYSEEGPKIYYTAIQVQPELGNIDLNYKYNAIYNLIHLASEEPSLISNPSTPASLVFDDDDDNLLATADLASFF